MSGSRLFDWLEAAAWLGGLPLVVCVLKPWLLARLRALPPLPPWPGTKGLLLRRREQALLDALAATRLGLVVGMALAPALRALDPPAPWQPLLGHVAALALFVQIGLWTGAFVDRWINTSRDHALQADPESATGLAAASFLLRLLIWSLLLLALLDNVGVNVTALLAGLGVGGIAVGLALQSVLKDLFASLSIVLDKPFQIGHFIIVDGMAGTVENIGLRTTRVRAQDGELYVFSNADLTVARVRNFRAMRERRIEHRFALRADSDCDALQRVPELLRCIVQEQPQARFDRAHLKDIDGEGLRFEMIYWITDPDYRIYMDTRQAINLALLRALRGQRLSLAQPVREIRDGGGALDGAGPALSSL